MPSWRDPDVTVVGGGMAGCEAAWQLAELGFRVALCEASRRRCRRRTRPRYSASWCAATRCGPTIAETPAGMLKRELRAAGSLLMTCAAAHRVPAGAALAVDRFGFGRARSPWRWRCTRGSASSAARSTTGPTGR
jgi:methylenetetrahydrofolate--tRNA-(uracil-5-)-methyltransferase